MAAVRLWPITTRWEVPSRVSPVVGEAVSTNKKVMPPSVVWNTTCWKKAKVESLHWGLHILGEKVGAVAPMGVTFGNTQWSSQCWNELPQSLLQSSSSASAAHLSPLYTTPWQAEWMYRVGGWALVYWPRSLLMIASTWARNHCLEETSVNQVIHTHKSPGMGRLNNQQMKQLWQYGRGSFQSWLARMLSLSWKQLKAKWTSKC